MAARTALICKPSIAYLVDVTPTDVVYNGLVLYLSVFRKGMPLIVKSF